MAESLVGDLKPLVDINATIGSSWSLGVKHTLTTLEEGLISES